MARHTSSRPTNPKPFMTGSQQDLKRLGFHDGQIDPFDDPVTALKLIAACTSQRIPVPPEIAGWFISAVDQYMKMKKPSLDKCLGLSIEGDKGRKPVTEKMQEYIDYSVIRAIAHFRHQGYSKGEAQAQVAELQHFGQWITERQARSIAAKQAKRIEAELSRLNELDKKYSDSKSKKVTPLLEKILEQLRLPGEAETIRDFIERRKSTLTLDSQLNSDLKKADVNK